MSKFANYHDSLMYIGVDPKVLEDMAPHKAYYTIRLRYFEQLHRIVHGNSIKSESKLLQHFERLRDELPERPETTIVQSIGTLPLSLDLIRRVFAQAERIEDKMNQNEDGSSRKKIKAQYQSFLDLSNALDANYALFLYKAVEQSKEAPSFVSNWKLRRNQQLIALYGDETLSDLDIWDAMHRGVDDYFCDPDKTANLAKKAASAVLAVTNTGLSGVDSLLSMIRYHIKQPLSYEPVPSSRIKQMLIATASFVLMGIAYQYFYAPVMFALRVYGLFAATEAATYCLATPVNTLVRPLKQLLDLMNSYRMIFAGLGVATVGAGLALYLMPAYHFWFMFKLMSLMTSALVAFTPIIKFAQSMNHDLPGMGYAFAGMMVIYLSIFSPGFLWFSGFLLFQPSHLLANIGTTFGLWQLYEDVIKQFFVTEKTLPQPIDNMSNEVGEAFESGDMSQQLGQKYFNLPSETDEECLEHGLKLF